ncbi:MAG: O-methyltransferase [Anaerolineales bacterium]|nr:O-methyltransferase [Anaerolineales bacterium]
MTLYNDAAAQYIHDLFVPDEPILPQVMAAIPARGLPAIAIKPEEGRFLQFLVRAVGARRVVEIGTLGGYSGIWIARGLPAGGRLTTLELDPKHAAVAREHFALAGVQDKVEIRVGDARQTLPELSAAGPFDFVFIDADKGGYGLYLDWALENVEPGGLITAHNAFRAGGVFDPTDNSADAREMRAFNARWAAEPKLLSTLYPAGDGLLMGVVLD